MDTEDRLKADDLLRAVDPAQNFRIDTYGCGDVVTITHLPTGATSIVRGCQPASRARSAAWCILRERLRQDGFDVQWPQEALTAFGAAIKDPPGGTAVEKSLPVGDGAADPAEGLLKEALKIVTGARRAAYGKPEDNFATIAGLWNTFCRRRGLDFTDPEQGFTAGDTAVMMILLKCARLGESPGHVDSVVDIAGYAACLRRCQAAAEQKP